MINLELRDLTLSDIGSTDFCLNASHVLKTETNVFVLKKGRIGIYDAKFQRNIEFDETQELPVFECTTKLSYLTIQEKLWFGTGTEFVCISTNTPSSYFIIKEDKEFSVAEWDSSYNYLAIVRTDGEIGVYTVDFDNCCLLTVSTGHLNDETLENALVNVGWGSENTQFDHSKVRTITSKKSGNEVALKQDSVDIPEEPKYFEDDMKPRLSWKLDSTMFGINYYSDGKRRIKVYLMNCKVHCIYDEIMGLLPIIAWHPSYTFISTAVWTNKQYSFILLGRSTLEKHIFEIQIQAIVKEIKWDPVEKHLALRQCSCEGITTISLYTFLNYEWYLKQCFRFSSEKFIDYNFISSPRQCAIEISTHRGIASYYFKYSIHHNRDIAAKDRLTAAILNGQKLYLSFFKEGVIPCPLYHLVIPTNNPINFVSFHPQQQVLATLDSENVISIYSFSTETFTLTSTFKIPCLEDFGFPLQIRNLCWKKDKQIIFLKTGTIGNYAYFLNMEGESKEWKIESILNGDNVQYINVVRNSDTLIAENNQQLSLYDSDNRKTLVSQTIMYTHCDSTIINLDTQVFGLSDSCFYVNGILLHNYILSFVVHENYLVLVTCDYQLMVIKLDSYFIKEISKFKFDHVYTRPVDSGDQLLFAIPNTSNLLMQNKRGNFELYSCRIMSIDRVHLLLKENRWSEALSILRLEKVDFNVIVDLDADWFIKNVDTFLKSVQNRGLLNEFLVSLNDSNVFHSLYKDCGIKSPILENKCTIICNAIIASMKDFNYIYFIRSIAIAEIMKSQPSITGALTHISCLLSISNEEESYASIAESTLLVLQTLKSNLDLYNIALSMYDLSLAVFVATVLSIDPSEYEPFIQSVEKLDECSKRFEINKHLKKFDKGLFFCIRLCNDDEIYEYIVKHDLSTMAYPLLKHDKPVLATKILMLVASKLSAKKKYEEAAVLYLSADLKTEAFNEYVLGLVWKPAINLMKHLDITSAKKSRMFLDMANGLIAKGKILDASYIFDKYLNKYEEAIKILLEHDIYSTAVELAKEHNRQDIIDFDVKTAIDDHLKALNIRILEIDVLFKKYKNRLLDLRQHKLKLITGAFDDYDDTEFDDMSSHIGSVISGFSAYTSRTGFTVKSASRRKAERKKDDLREGSHFEDIALLKALYNLLEETFRYGPDVREIILLSISVKHGVTPLMFEVHNKLESIQNDMISNVGVIWSADMNNPIQSSNMNQIYQNLSEMDVKYRAPPKLETTWTIKTLLELNISV